MANYLGRDAILAADDLDYQDVDVPEWGGTVRVRSLTVHQRDQLAMTVVSFDDSIRASRANGDAELKLNRDGLAELKAQIVVWTACDGDGQRLFSQKDLAAVGEKSPDVIDRLSDTALEISGVTELGGRAARKNSGTGQNAGSDSA